MGEGNQRAGSLKNDFNGWTVLSKPIRRVAFQRRRLDTSTPIHGWRGFAAVASARFALSPTDSAPTDPIDDVVADEGFELAVEQRVIVVFAESNPEDRHSRDKEFTYSNGCHVQERSVQLTSAGSPNGRLAPERRDHQLTHS